MSGKRPAETIQTLLEAESEAKLVVEKARKGTHRFALCWLLEWVPPQRPFSRPLACATIYSGHHPCRRLIFAAGWGVRRLRLVAAYVQYV